MGVKSSLSVILVLAVITFISVVDRSFSSKDSDDVRPFPDFKLTTLYAHNDIIDQSVLKSKISLVNIFGSWCAPCLVEHPFLMELAQNQTVQIVGVNWQDTKPKAFEWLAKHGDPYDEIVFDKDGVLYEKLKFRGVPTAYLINANGEIVFSFSGILKPEVWERSFAPRLKAMRVRS